MKYGDKSKFVGLMNVFWLVLLSGGLAYCSDELVPPPLEILSTIQSDEDSLGIDFELIKKMKPDEAGFIYFAIKLYPGLISDRLLIKEGRQLVADPFAPEPKTEESYPEKILTPRQAIEKMGVSLDQDSQIAMDSDEYIMSVKVKPDEAQFLLMAFMGGHFHPELGLFYQLDRFEMPLELAREVQDQVFSKKDHGEGRRLAIDLLAKGKASVETVTVGMRSGSRALLAKVENERGEGRSGEISPVLGADNHTIDTVLDWGGLSTKFSSVTDETVMAGVDVQAAGMASVLFVKPTIRGREQPVTQYSVSAILKSEDSRFDHSVTDSSIHRIKTRKYKVPWMFYIETGDFNSDGKKHGPQAYFESKGIQFENGHSVEYSRQTKILKITHQADVLMAIDFLMKQYRRDIESRVFLTFDAYRVHSSHSHQLIQSVEKRVDHSAEKNAIEKAVTQGHARLEDCRSVIVKSGETAAVGQSASALKSDAKLSTSGIYVDPVLGINNRIVDLNFSYHSVDEKYKISNQMTLVNHEPYFAGSWTNADGSHTVLFVTPRIHYINDWFTRIDDSGE